MKKSRIILAAICLFAGIGGALAFKTARQTIGFVYADGLTATFAATTEADCTAGVGGCVGDSEIGVRQLYTYGAGNVLITLEEES